MALSITLSVIALVLAGLSAWYTRQQAIGTKDQARASETSAHESKRSADAAAESAQVAKEALAIEKRRLQAEGDAAARAVITTWVAGDKFFVRNEGPSLARDITVDAPGAPFHDVVTIGVARPRQEFDFLFFPAFGDQVPVSGKLTWTDGLGDHEDDIEIRW